MTEVCQFDFMQRPALALQRCSDVGQVRASNPSSNPGFCEVLLG
jgi:hypothetical protein